VRVVEEHDLSQNNSLFMYVALQVMHAPQEVPEEYSSIYPSPKYFLDYSVSRASRRVTFGTPHLRIPYSTLMLLRGWVSPT
jgi:hypothetical protein